MTGLRRIRGRSSNRNSAASPTPISTPSFTPDSTPISAPDSISATIFRTFGRRLVVVALIVLQAACEGPGFLTRPSDGVADPEGAWRARQVRLAGLTAFEVDGRMAVRTADDAVTASLRWRQRDREFDIQLSGPLGQGAMRLHGDGRKVVLRTADGMVRTAASAEAMLRERTGLDVPVSVLRYWVIGLPSPDWPTDGYELDPLGRLRALRQGDWKLEILRYGRYGPTDRPDEAVILPKKIRMEGAGVSVRIVLKRWVVDAPVGWERTRAAARG